MAWKSKCIKNQKPNQNCKKKNLVFVDSFILLFNKNWIIYAIFEKGIIIKVRKLNGLTIIYLKLREDYTVETF
jgi:hypothetical protein